MAEENNKWHIGRLMQNEQTKNYFAIFATLILLIVLIILIYPAIQHVSRVNKEITDAKEIEQALEEKLRNIEQAKTNLEAVEEDLALLDLALPVGSDFVSYVQRIEAFAKKYKLAVEKAEFNKVPLSKPPINNQINTRNLDYSITFSGKFEDFKKFLAGLENYIRTTDINLVSVEKEEKENDIKLLQSIEATTYYIGLELEEKKTSTVGEKQ